MSPVPQGSVLAIITAVQNSRKSESQTSPSPITKSSSHDFTVYWSQLCLSEDANPLSYLKGNKTSFSNLALQLQLQLYQILEFEFVITKLALLQFSCDLSQNPVLPLYKGAVLLQF